MRNKNMENEVEQYLVTQDQMNKGRSLDTVSMIYPNLKNKAGGKPALVKCLERLVKKNLIIKCVFNNGTVAFKAA
jgi:hypothetical protein